MRLGVVMLACSIGVGCSVETGVWPGRDGLDSGTATDGARSDSGGPARDGAAPDATRDGGSLPPEDGGVLTLDGGRDGGSPVVDGGTDAGPPGCNTRYGDTNGYLLCDESELLCEFYVIPWWTIDCTGICADRGGACREAHSNGGIVSGMCTRGGAVPCSTLSYDLICVCTR